MIGRRRGRKSEVSAGQERCAVAIMIKVIHRIMESRDCIIHSRRRRGGHFPPFSSLARRNAPAKTERRRKKKAPTGTDDDSHVFENNHVQSLPLNNGSPKNNNKQGRERDERGCGAGLSLSPLSSLLSPLSPLSLLCKGSFVILVLLLRIDCSEGGLDINLPAVPMLCLCCCCLSLLKGGQVILLEQMICTYTTHTQRGWNNRRRGLVVSN